MLPLPAPIPASSVRSPRRSVEMAKEQRIIWQFPHRQCQALLAQLLPGGTQVGSAGVVIYTIFFHG
jgi:hypothetical protein